MEEKERWGREERTEIGEKQTKGCGGPSK